MANDIDIGLFSINTDHLVDGEALSTVAVAAERAAAVPAPARDGHQREWLDAAVLRGARPPGVRRRGARQRQRRDRARARRLDAAARGVRKRPRGRGAPAAGPGRCRRGPAGRPGWEWEYGLGKLVLFDVFGNR